MAKELLEKEILYQADLEKLIGKRPFTTQTTYEAFVNEKDEEEPEEKPVVNDEAGDNGTTEKLNVDSEVDKNEKTAISTEVNNSDKNDSTTASSDDVDDEVKPEVESKESA